MKGFYRLILVLSTFFIWFPKGTLASTNTKNPYSISDYYNNQALALYKNDEIRLFKYNSKKELKEGLSILEKDSNIAIVQPNFTYSSSGFVDDADYPKQWALKNEGIALFTERDEKTGNTNKLYSKSGIDINIERAWELGLDTKREVVVALIDTGIDINHEDISQNIWVNTLEIPENGIDDDNNGFVDDINGWNFFNFSNKIYNGKDDNHGTHSAGSIAGVSNNQIGITGIVKDSPVKIMPIKVLGGDKEEGLTTSVVSAIRYAEENGASICNLSLGTRIYDPILYRVMENSKMLFVVASGNSGEDIDVNPLYPTNYQLPNIVAVANIAPDGSLHSSSNYGFKNVDVTAPGTFIYSTLTENSYGYMTGTSMSAPIFTASVAYIYSNTDKTIMEAKDALLSTVKPLDNLKGVVLTGGIIDVGRAMEMLVLGKGPTISLDTAIPFKDVAKDSKYYEAIRFLYENSVMMGIKDDEFGVDYELNRSMTVTILGRLVKAEPIEANSFSDVKANSWYSGYVGWAVKNNIIYGYGNNRFGTKDSVTGNQLNQILGRYAKSLGKIYDSGLYGDTPLTRGETADAFYKFYLNMNTYINEEPSF